MNPTAQLREVLDNNEKDCFDYAEAAGIDETKVSTIIGSSNQSQRRKHTTGSKSI